MANAGRDGNFVPTLIAALNTDGATIVAIKGNSANNKLKISDGATGSDHGPANALHDQNHTATATVFSNADGTTVVALYGDSSGNLLIKST